MEVTGIPLARLRSLQSAPHSRGGVAEKSEEETRPEDSEQGRHEVNSPENPMKARDRVPAMMSTKPMLPPENCVLPQPGSCRKLVSEMNSDLVAAYD